jgi:sortase A
MTVGARARYRKALGALEVTLWCLAAALLGCYACVYLDRTVYQAYQAWSFNQALDHKPASAVGFLLHSLPPREPAPVSKDAGNAFSNLAIPRPSGGSLPARAAVVGRLEIPRLGLRAMIVNGTTEECLRRAVGHIEGTPLFDQAGNVGLAGHRDTLFRGLRRIRKGDKIEVRTLHAAYEYVVEGTEIVSPNDMQVLEASARPTLTLVTCYPFDYIGSAPRRFIVRARATSSGGLQLAARP